MMDFSSVIPEMRKGFRLYRESWFDRGEFIFIVPGSRFTVSRHPLLGIFPEGAEVEYHEHIDFRMSDGRIVPWVPTQDDLLSSDWAVH